MASHLTREHVERIAELARLELTAEELALYAHQLTAILDYAAQIQRVDTTGVPPASGDASTGTWRADEASATLPREEALAQAPDASADAALFRVPKVI